MFESLYLKLVQFVIGNENVFELIYMIQESVTAGVDFSSLYMFYFLFFTFSFVVFCMVLSFVFKFLLKLVD